MYTILVSQIRKLLYLHDFQEFMMKYKVVHGVGYIILMRIIKTSIHTYMT
jgi:hypothetical protein